MGIETTLDARAAHRANYDPNQRVTLPLPLQSLRCISVLRLEYGTKEALDEGCGPIDYSIGSYDISEYPERDIIAAAKFECSKADHFTTYGGKIYELPILFNRALVHGINPNAFLERHVQHATARFYGGHAAVQSLPKDLCASLRIPYPHRQPEAAEDAFYDPRLLAKHCEKSTVSTWLLDEFWRNGDDPLLVRTRWGMFGGWVQETPGLDHLIEFATFAPEGVIRPSELRDQLRTSG